MTRLLVAVAALWFSVDALAAQTPAPAIAPAPRDAAAARGFNPQPDPPGKSPCSEVTARGTDRREVSPGAARGFNPQPDPPGSDPCQTQELRRFP